MKSRGISKESSLLHLQESEEPHCSIRPQCPLRPGIPGILRIPGFLQQLSHFQPGSIRGKHPANLFLNCVLTLGACRGCFGAGSLPFPSTSRAPSSQFLGRGQINSRGTKGEILLQQHTFHDLAGTGMIPFPQLRERISSVIQHHRERGAGQGSGEARKPQR